MSGKTFDKRSEVIFFYRRQSGIRQDDLAARVGISVAYLSQVENGHREPSTGLFQELCDAMGVQVSIQYVVIKEPYVNDKTL